MKAGEVFSPHGRFHGLFIPEALFDVPDLKDADVLMWGRLAKFAGKDDHCFPSLETLAAESRSSVDAVGRSLKRLESAGLIRRTRRGSGRTAVCEFIWHPALGRSLRAGDSAKVRNQSKPQTPQNERSDSAQLRNQDSANLPAPYTEEKNQFEKNQRKESSSMEQHGMRKRSATTTTADPMMVWWTEADVDHLRSCLRGLKYPPRGLDSKADTGPLPDLAITSRILSHLAGTDDLHAWLQGLPWQIPRQFSSGGYGWFLRDVSNCWPERRGAGAIAKPLTHHGRAGVGYPGYPPSESCELTRPQSFGSSERVGRMAPAGELFRTLAFGSVAELRA